MPDLEAIFGAICDAILEDGQVEPWEQHLMRDAALLLGLEQSEALRIFSERRKAARPATADRAAIYADLVRAIARDGEVDNLEGAALAGLRRALKISDQQHRDAVDAATGS